MTTRIEPLSRDDQELYGVFLTEGKPSFLYGMCYAFAIALHHGLGWPMVGPRVEPGEQMWHVALRRPDGRLHDARGPLSDQEFGVPFARDCGTYVLVDVTEAELQNMKFHNDHMIVHARRVAEHTWPELPWKETRSTRLVAFADELEALSRKHGLWLRAPFPNTPPVISESGDAEDGYTLTPMLGGLGFTIDRRLK